VVAHLVELVDLFEKVGGVGQAAALVVEILDGIQYLFCLVFQKRLIQGPFPIIDFAIDGKLHTVIAVQDVLLCTNAASEFDSENAARVILRALFCFMGQMLVGDEASLGEDNP